MAIASVEAAASRFRDTHKVKLGKNRSKTNGVKLSKMASGLWVSLRYFKHLRNSESGFQNLTSNLSWPGVGRDHRCRLMHFSADIAQNLMGSARLTEANP